MTALTSPLNFLSSYIAMVSHLNLIPLKNQQTNAFVERVHQGIGDAIRSMELHTKHCNNVTIRAVLQNVFYGLQATYHSFFAASPGQLVFGRNMVINSIYLSS
jgi:hypothetical protein